MRSIVDLRQNRRRIPVIAILLLIFIWILKLAHIFVQIFLGSIKSGKPDCKIIADYSAIAIGERLITLGFVIFLAIFLIITGFSFIYKVKKKTGQPLLVNKKKKQKFSSKVCFL